MINLNNASLLASTIPLNLNATDFFAQQYAFSGEGGFLMNDGKIVGNNADLVALIANAIENSGTIEVPMGTVALAAGNTVTVGISPDGMVSIGVDEATANTMGLKDQIKNSGSITADGGKVILTAQAMDGLFEKAIRIEKNAGAVTAIKADDGTIQFQSMDDIYNDAIIQAMNGQIVMESQAGSVTNKDTVQAQGGVIDIDAAQNVENSGILDVSTAEAVKTAGSIDIRASKVGQLGAIQADSETGNAGSINIHADELLYLGPDSLTTANAIQSGNGGRIIYFSPDTAVFREGGRIEAKGGALSGNGGWVEVSGKEHVQIHGTVDTSSVNGTDGTFYIDPTDVVTVGTSYGGDWEDMGGWYEWNSDEFGSSMVNIFDLLYYSSVLIDAWMGSVVFAQPISYAGNNNITVLAVYGITFASGADITLSGGSNLSLDSISGPITNPYDVTITMGTGSLFLRGEGIGDADHPLKTSGLTNVSFDNIDMDSGTDMFLTEMSSSAINITSASNQHGGLSVANAGGSIAVTGGVNVVGGNIVLSADAITLSSDITTTTSGAVDLNGAVTLGNNVSVTTAGGATDNITFSSTIDSDATARSLTLNAGSGNVELQNSVGSGGIPLAFLDVTGSTIDIHEVTTTGSQIYSGMTTVRGDLSAGDNTNITFDGGPTTLDGDIAMHGGSGTHVGFWNYVQASGSFTVDAPLLSLEDLGGTIDGLTNFTAVDVAGTEWVDILASGDITITGTAEANTYEVLLHSSGGNISVGAITANSAYGMVDIRAAGIASVGAVTSSGSNVGGGYDGTTILIKGDSGVTLNGNLTANNQRAIKIEGPVTLGADVTVQTAGNSGDDIMFTSTIDSDSTPRSLNLNAGSGTINLGGVVGGSMLLGNLTVNSAVNDTPLLYVDHLNVNGTITVDAASTFSQGITVGETYGLSWADADMHQISNVRAAAGTGTADFYLNSGGMYLASGGSLTLDSINLGDVSSILLGGGGSFNIAGDVTVGNMLYDFAYSDSGLCSITVGGNITTGNIASYFANGTTNAVNISAAGNITTGTISYDFAANAGVSAVNIVTGSITGNFADATSTVYADNISTTGTLVNEGQISSVANALNITAQSINSPGTISSVNSGDLNLDATGTAGTFELGAVSSAGDINIGMSFHGVAEPASVTVNGPMTAAGNILIQSNGGFVQAGDISANGGRLEFNLDDNRDDSTTTYSYISGTITAGTTDILFGNGSGSATDFTIAGMNTSGNLNLGVYSPMGWVMAPGSVVVTGPVAAGSDITIYSNGDITQTTGALTAGNVNFYLDQDNSGTATLIGYGGINASSGVYINGMSSTALTLKDVYMYGTGSTYVGSLTPSASVTVDPGNSGGIWNSVYSTDISIYSNGDITENAGITQFANVRLYLDQDSSGAATFNGYGGTSASSAIYVDASSSTALTIQDMYLYIPTSDTTTVYIGSNTAPASVTVDPGLMGGIYNTGNHGDLEIYSRGDITANAGIGTFDSIHLYLDQAGTGSVTLTGGNILANDVYVEVADNITNLTLAGMSVSNGDGTSHLYIGDPTYSSTAPTKITVMGSVWGDSVCLGANEIEITDNMNPEYPNTVMASYLRMTGDTIRNNGRLGYANWGMGLYSPISVLLFALDPAGSGAATFSGGTIIANDVYVETASNTNLTIEGGAWVSNGNGTSHLYIGDPMYNSTTPSKITVTGSLGGDSLYLGAHEIEIADSGYPDYRNSITANSLLSVTADTIQNHGSFGSYYWESWSGMTNYYPVPEIRFYLDPSASGTATFYGGSIIANNTYIEAADHVTNLTLGGGTWVTNGTGTSNLYIGTPGHTTTTPSKISVTGSMMGDNLYLGADEIEITDNGSPDYDNNIMASSLYVAADTVRNNGSFGYQYYDSWMGQWNVYPISEIHFNLDSDASGSAAFVGSGSIVANNTYVEVADQTTSLSFENLWVTNGVGSSNLYIGTSGYNSSTPSQMIVTGSAMGDNLYLGANSLSLNDVSTAGVQQYTAGSIILNGAQYNSMTSGAISFNGAVTLANNVTVQTAGNPGDNINFNSTIDSDGTARSLTLNAGTTGVIYLTNAIGGTNSLSSFTANSAIVLPFDVTITTEGGVGNDILLNSTVDSSMAGVSSLTLNAGSGNVSLGGNVGSVNSLNMLTLTSGNLTASGTVYSPVTNYGTISGGTFESYVENYGLISGANSPTFNYYVSIYDGSSITGGSFANFVEIQNSTTITGGEFSASINNYGTVSGGTFNGPSFDNYGLISGDHSPVINSEAVLWGGSSITGGTFNGPAYFLGDGTLNISGVSFVSNLDIWSGATVSGGEIGVSLDNHGTISGGTFNNNVFNYGTISGGTFNGQYSDNYGLISGDNSPVFNSDAVLWGGSSITGGTFNGPIYFVDDTPGTLNITGGSFASNLDIWSGKTVSGGEISIPVDNHGTISGGTFNSYIDNYGAISNGTFTGSDWFTNVCNRSTGTISGGSFNWVWNEGAISNGAFSGQVNNYGTISAGTFSGSVMNGYNMETSQAGTLAGGSFSGDVYSDTYITGGTFTGSLEHASSEAITGGDFSNLTSLIIRDYSVWSYDSAVGGSVTNHGTISAGTFTGSWTNEADGVINGTALFDFSSSGTNLGTINGGTFICDLGFDLQGTVTGGEFYYPGMLNSSAAISGGTFNIYQEYPTSFNNNAGGSISGNATFHCPVTNNSTISGGTFDGAVTNNSVIDNGLFNSTVDNTNGTINDGNYTAITRAMAGGIINGGTFLVSGITISGLVSDLGGQAVRMWLSINGGAAVQADADTDVSGNFTFSNVTLNNDQYILIFSGDGSYRVNLAGKVLDSSSNITGLALERGRLSVGDSGQAGAALYNVMSNADLSSAYLSDTNVYYSVDGSNALLVSGIDLWVPSNMTLNPGGNVALNQTLINEGAIRETDTTIDLNIIASAINSPGTIEKIDMGSINLDSTGTPGAFNLGVINSAGAINIGVTTAPLSVTADSLSAFGAVIINTGDIDIVSLATTSDVASLTGANINVDDWNVYFDTVSAIHATGDVSINSDSNISLGGLGAANASLTSSNGWIGISSNGAWDVSGSTSLSAGEGVQAYFRIDDWGDMSISNLYSRGFTQLENAGNTISIIHWDVAGTARVLSAGGVNISSDSDISIESLLSNGSVTLQTGGDVTIGSFGGYGTGSLVSVNAAGANIDLPTVITTGAQSYTGATTLNGDLTSTGAGAITFNNAVTLANNVNITTAGTSGDDITFYDAINSDSVDTPRNLLLDAGTSGGINFGVDVGGIASLGTLTLGTAEHHSLVSGSSNFYASLIESYGNLVLGPAAVFYTTFNNYYTLDGGRYEGVVNNMAGGLLDNGTFNNSVNNSGDINLAPFNWTTFNGEVNNSGTIWNGTFADTGTVNNTGTISGGTFNGVVNNQSAGSIAGSVTNSEKMIFNDSSYIDSTGSISGDAEFNGSAHNVGTLNGNAIFNGSSYNAGLVVGNAEFTNTAYSTVLTGHFNPEQLGLVSGTTTFSGENVAFTLEGTEQWDADTSSWVFSGGTPVWTFNGQSNNYGVLNGDAVFHDLAYNGGNVEGNADFAENAYSTALTGRVNPQQGISGTTTFSGTNVAFTLEDGEDWSADTSAWGFSRLGTPVWTFNGSSFNNAGTLNGNAIFNGSSFNAGAVLGNAEFTNAVYSTALTGRINPQQGTAGTTTFSATNVVFDLEGTESWDADTTAWVFSGGTPAWTFDEMSSNYGVLAGNAFFNGSSYNAGDVAGAAEFNGSSTMAYGFISGAATINSDSFTLQSDLNVGGTLTIGATGVLDLAGRNINSTGNVINNGTLILQGGESISDTDVALNADGSLVKYNAIGAMTLKAWEYYNLTLAGDAVYTVGGATVRAGGTGDIIESAKVARTVTATGIDRTYNADTDATVNLTLDDNIFDAWFDAGTPGYAEAAFASKNVGTQDIAVSGIYLNGADASKFEPNVTASTTADITAKAITVTVDAGQSKVYGDLDPELTYSSTALAGSDSWTGVLSRVAGENVADGPYAINQGTLDAGSNYALTFIRNNFSITPKALTVTVDAAQTKVYGAVDPTLTYQSSGLVGADSLSGALSRVAGETVAGGPYAINQGTLDAGSNYALTFIGNNFSITPKSLTVTVDGGQSKVYGAADPTLTYQSSGLVGTDSLSGVLSRVAGETVAGGPYAINQGTLDAGSNYALTFIGNNFSITPKALTVTVDGGQSKVYGAADPTLTYQSSGLVGADALSGALNRVAGETVAGGPYAINQGTLDAGSNYALTFVGNNFSITPKALTITANDQLKTYGDSILGTTAFTAAGLVAGETIDSVTLSTDALLSTSNHYRVGNWAITASDPLGTGFDATNYAINYGIGSLNVTARSITLAGITASNKVYDATTAATVDASSATFAGKLGSDVLTVSSTGTFDDKNVANGKNVTLTNVLGGADLGNYTITDQGTTTANITARTLTLDATGVDRVYDATTNATVTLSDDRIAGDVLTGSYSASFADKNVGIGKTVTVTGLSISGADASNYTLSSTTDTTTANITKATATLSGITAANKVYDATRDAAISTAVATFAGKYAGDELTVTSTGMFNDKNAGNNKTVILTNVLGGADLGNYLVTDQGTTTANITAKAITLSGITASNKIYDGTTVATVSTAGATFTGVIGGDNLTVSSTGTFSNKNVGNNKTVTLTNTLGGTSLGNYTVSEQSATTANITAKDLTVTASGVNKTFDDTLQATVNLADNRVVGDALNNTYTSAVFDTKEIGTNKTVTVNGIAISGADATNYNLMNTTATTTANITAVVPVTTTPTTPTNDVIDRTISSIDTTITNTGSAVGTDTGIVPNIVTTPPTSGGTTNTGTGTGNVTGGVDAGALFSTNTGTGNIDMGSVMNLGIEAGTMTPPVVTTPAPVVTTTPTIVTSPVAPATTPTTATTPAPVQTPAKTETTSTASNNASSQPASVSETQPAANPAQEVPAKKDDSAAAQAQERKVAQEEAQEREVAVEENAETPSNANAIPDTKGVNWRDVPLQGFFKDEEAKKLLTDVRVIEGAVYVIDGANTMNLLGMGDSLRLFYKNHRRSSKTGAASKPEMPAVKQALQNILNKAAEEPVVPAAPDARVLKPAMPIVMHQTASGERYGTLKNPGKDVFVRSNGGEWKPATDGMTILPGDEVRTASENFVKVLLDGGKTGSVEIKEGSLFRIQKAEGDPKTGEKTTILDLAVGKILVKVDHLKGNSKFEVRTPTALTGVRGTEFEVTVKEKA
jgi:hypothetical protein